MVVSDTWWTCSMTSLPQAINRRLFAVGALTERIRAGSRGLHIAQWRRGRASLKIWIVGRSSAMAAGPS